MRQYHVALIRVLTTGCDVVTYFQEENLEHAFPQLSIETFEIPDQPEGIHDNSSYKKAVPKIMALARQIAPSFEGIMINCAGDPAVDILEKELTIPVTGAGRPAALLALAKSDKVGVLGINKECPDNYREVLGDSLTGYECPEGIVTSSDLQTEEGKKAIRSAAEILVAKGADTIVFACTGYTVTGVLDHLRDLPVRIIDPSYAQALQMLAECFGKYGTDLRIH